MATAKADSAESQNRRQLSKESYDGVLKSEQMHACDLPIGVYNFRDITTAEYTDAKQQEKEISIIYYSNVATGQQYRFVHFQLSNFSWEDDDKVITINNAGLDFNKDSKKTIYLAESFSVVKKEPVKANSGKHPLLYPLNCYVGYDTYLKSVADKNITTPKSVLSKQCRESDLLDAQQIPFHSIVIDTPIVSQV